MSPDLYGARRLSVEFAIQLMISTQDKWSVDDLVDAARDIEDYLTAAPEDKADVD